LNAGDGGVVEGRAGDLFGRIGRGVPWRLVPKTETNTVTSGARGSPFAKFRVTDFSGKKVGDVSAE